MSICKLCGEPCLGSYHDECWEEKYNSGVQKDDDNFHESQQEA